ncbi:MAG TPA: hypothetical protein VMI56_23785 [Reyranella sp.]|nr:hypothetical protein [Reyranella sp.]
MESRRLVSTSLDGLRPIGRLGERNHAQLVAYLAGHPELGPDVGALFAEPVPSRDGSQVDWYVEGDRRALPVDSLDAAKQTELVDRITQQLAAIRQEGERLNGIGDPLGPVLIAASETPAPLARYLHVLGEGETPVLVCWGYTDDTPRATGALPQAMKAAPLAPPFIPDPAEEPAVAPIVKIVEKRSSFWWLTLWPVLAALLIAVGWLLLRGCGIAWPGDLDHGFLYCRPGSEALASEVERGRDLDAQAHQLEMKLIQGQTTCLANRPPPLPKDRWNDKDLSVLAGCWTLGHDTQSIVVDDTGRQQTCTVHAGTICFGKDGTGTREQTTDCGTTRFSVCKAGVKAHFTDEGALATEQPETKCNPQTITWHSKPNALICKRVDEGGALCRDGDNFEHEFRPKTGK